MKKHFKIIPLVLILTVILLNSIKLHGMSHKIAFANTLEFSHAYNWGAVMPTHKIIDADLFWDYWVMDNNKDVVVCLSENDAKLMVANNNVLPEITKENIKQISLSKKLFSDNYHFEAKWNLKQSIWQPIETVAVDLDKSDIDFIFNVLQKDFKCFEDSKCIYDRNTIEIVERYFLQIHFYSDDYLYYEPDIYLVKDINGEYYIEDDSFDYKLSFSAQEKLNRKIL